MRISLNKNSNVLLHQQLAEQIVFLITAGRLKTRQQLPSVRSLARQLQIHHNTVSKAYQDLVRRGWLSRQRGSRLYVGGPPHVKSMNVSLDELIDQTVEHAREKGFSLKALRDKVLERLSAEPPDHILVVEDEQELGQIIQTEIYKRVGKDVEICTIEEFLKSPNLAMGAEIAITEYVVHMLKKPLFALNRQYSPLIFSQVDEHIAFIKNLKDPSIIGIASVSRSLLRTAQGLLAPVVNERHTVKEFLLPMQGNADLRGIDVVFCDSLTMPRVRCRRKRHYRLIAPECIEDLAALLSPIIPENSPLVKTGLRSRKKTN